MKESKKNPAEALFEAIRDHIIFGRDSGDDGFLIKELEKAGLFVDPHDEAEKTKKEEEQQRQRLAPPKKATKDIDQIDTKDEFVSLLKIGVLAKVFCDEKIDEFEGKLKDMTYEQKKEYLEAINLITTCDTVNDPTLKKLLNEFKDFAKSDITRLKNTLETNLLKVAALPKPDRASTLVNPTKTSVTKIQPQQPNKKVSPVNFEPNPPKF